jgi:Spy/CpxP family protein refolding chaperone
MERSLGGIKSKAYLIIVGAFFIGVVTGSLLMNLVVAKVPSTPVTKPTMLDELADELKLTPEQKAQVGEIYKDSRQKGKDLAKALQPQMDELRVQTKAKVKMLLTPEQQARYATWCTRREADRQKNERK